MLTPQACGGGGGLQGRPNGPKIAASAAASATSAAASAASDVASAAASAKQLVLLALEVGVVARGSKRLVLDIRGGDRVHVPRAARAPATRPSLRPTDIIAIMVNVTAVLSVFVVVELSGDVAQWEPSVLRLPLLGARPQLGGDARQEPRAARLGNPRRSRCF